MKISKTGYTPRQKAYAMGTLGGKGKSKKEIALHAGYSPSMAENAKPSIEDSVGFNNAMADLAGETGNVVMQIYHTIKNKDLNKESVDTLMNAVTVLSQAFERFTPKKNKDDDGNAKGNPLRGLFTVQPVKSIDTNATEVVSTPITQDDNPF